MNLYESRNNTNIEAIDKLYEQLNTMEQELETNINLLVNSYVYAQQYIKNKRTFNKTLNNLKKSLSYIRDFKNIINGE